MTTKKTADAKTRTSGMRLSRRVTELKPSATLAVSARAKALKAEGVDVIAFGAGEPDLATPRFICDAAKRAIDEGWTKYTASAGDPAAREVIAKKLREENGLMGMGADGVVITAGAKMGIYLAMQALVDPECGDEVILQTPCYVSYAPIARLCGGKVVEVETRIADGFRMSAEGLREVLSERSRVLVINSPANPTGVVYSAEELKAIAEVVNEHNREQRESGGGELVVLSDEIYEKLIYADGVEFVSICSFVEDGCFVVINGLSKSYAMTGWRIGYAGAGRVEVAKAMAKLQVQMNTCITGCCYPVIVEAIEGGDDAIDEMRGIYRKRWEVVCHLLEGLPGVKFLKPSGAFYVFVEVSGYYGRRSGRGMEIRDAVSFAEALLVEGGVAVVPGDDFGGCGSDFVRISYACSEDSIREGLGRMKGFLEVCGE